MSANCGRSGGLPQSGRLETGRPTQAPINARRAKPPQRRPRGARADRRRGQAMQRAQLLRELVLDSQYVVDEGLVAGAILARTAERNLTAMQAGRRDARARRWRATIASC